MSGPRAGTGRSKTRTRRRAPEWPEPFLPSTLGGNTLRGWRFPPHLQRLEEVCLRLVEDPSFNRLVVELPVRHGKSWYCSHVFAAWYLLNYPHNKVILASFEKDFAAEWCVKVQSTIALYGETLTGVRLGDVQRQDHFTLAPPWTGELRTTSPGSSPAGRGADLIIPDDLIKDMRQVANPLQRHALATWCASELLTRLEPGGKVLAVMSRRHPDDQSGKWLGMNGELPPEEQWHRLRMPALAEEDDPLGRAPGEALWPQRWSREKLLAKKHAYELDGQSYLWDSLYQQDPRGDSTLIEWPETYWSDATAGWAIGYDDLPPALPVRFRVLALDPSKGSNSKTGDYSAWADARVDAKATLWVEPHLRVMPTESVEDYTVELLSRTRYDAVVVECNGFQEVIADNIVKKCRARGVPCPMHKKESLENKEVRIRLGVGPLLAQRRIRLWARSPSYRLALAQLREFPTGAHDDFPDSLNLAIDLVEFLLTGRR